MLSTDGKYPPAVAVHAALQTSDSRCVHLHLRGLACLAQWKPARALPIIYVRQSHGQAEVHSAAHEPRATSAGSIAAARSLEQTRVVPVFLCVVEVRIKIHEALVNAAIQMRIESTQHLGCAAKSHRGIGLLSVGIERYKSQVVDRRPHF